MHLMSTAYGLGAKWTTPAFMKLPEVKVALGLPEEGKVMGLFLWVPRPGVAGVASLALEFVTRWKTSQEAITMHERKPTV